MVLNKASRLYAKLKCLNTRVSSGEKDQKSQALISSQMSYYITVVIFSAEERQVQGPKRSASYRSGLNDGSNSTTLETWHSERKDRYAGSIFSNLPSFGLKVLPIYGVDFNIRHFGCSMDYRDLYPVYGEDSGVPVRFGEMFPKMGPTSVVQNGLESFFVNDR